MLEDRAGVTDLRHLPGVHDHHAVRVVRHHRHVVGYEDDGKTKLELQLLDLRHERTLRDHVERRRRLVHDHELRREEQGHGDHGALPHAATQLMRIAVEMLGVDPDQAEDLSRASADALS